MVRVVGEERLPIKQGRLKNNKVFRIDSCSIMSEGYGVIPKRVMRDKQLSIEAKAIYAYLCSYAGGGNEAFPSVIKMLGDLQVSENRFYKHMNNLIDSGYIVKRRIMDENNLFRNNVYEIVQIKEEDSGYF